MKNEALGYPKMVVKTHGRRVDIMWCNGQTRRADPIILRESYDSLETALPDIKRWYAAQYSRP